MDQRLNNILKEYDSFYDNNFKNKIPLKINNSGVYAPANMHDLVEIFKKYADKKSSFLDLGSGDGVAVQIASCFFLDATGIELDKDALGLSLMMQKKLHSDNVKLKFGDYFDIDISNYDVIFIAPDSPITLKLENKFLDELKGLLIVYSGIFQPKLLDKVSELSFPGVKAAIYRNRPKKVFSSSIKTSSI